MTSKTFKIGDKVKIVSYGSFNYNYPSGQVGIITADGGYYDVDLLNGDRPWPCKAKELEKENEI